MRTPKPEYIQAASTLDNAEKERLFSRMGSKITRKVVKQKIEDLEALAIQLEIEDEQLAEWLEKIRQLRK
jgi:N-acyl-L-homoserine lactone synthetase